jgi:hypothetical protein
MDLLCSVACRLVDQRSKAQALLVVDIAPQPVEEHYGLVLHTLDRAEVKPPAQEPGCDAAILEAQISATALIATDGGMTPRLR